MAKWFPDKRGLAVGLAAGGYGAGSAIFGPRIGGVLYDRYHNYQAAFYIAAVLSGVALLCELGARRPAD
jgi:MFS family permease